MTEAVAATHPGDPEHWGPDEAYLKRHLDRVTKSVQTSANRVGESFRNPIFYRTKRPERIDAAARLLIQAHIALLEAHKLLADEFYGNDGVSKRDKKRIADAEAWIAGQMGVAG